MTALQAGQRLTVSVEKPVAGGRMIARHEGAVLLVAGVIPGEVAEVEVERVQRGTAWATVRRVVEPSQDRIVPACDPTCGGMQYAHVRYERQLALKREVLSDALVRLARFNLEMDVPVVPSSPEGYRMRARLHLRDGRPGFFREGSRELCDARTTRQLRDDTLDVVEQLAAAVAAIPRAEIVDIEIAENVPATERVCHLNIAPESDPSRLALAASVSGLTGLSCSGSAKARSVTLSGQASLTDVLEVSAGRPVTLTREVRAFFQANRYLLTGLASRVGELVPPGHAVDLYAGVGLFAVTLAGRGDVSVTAVEGDRVSAADLKRNASPLGERLKVYHLPVEQFPRTVEPRETSYTVILDPPCTGVSPAAMQVVTGLRATRLVYVSCDVATLARDARALVNAGYRLESLEVFDLFPNTPHVETVAVFDR